MFDSLKTAMSEQRSGGSFKDIMKTSIGNNYIIRLIPNVKNIADTTYHYYSHGWQSLATGQFISCVCPITTGQRCPICEERIRLYRGDDDDKKNAKLLGRKEQWLINVFVVDDPSTKENTNTVKILRYGKQLDKVIKDATEGIDKDEFGVRIFDLSESGCNLRITVEKNDGGYPSYTSSKFLRESKLASLDDAKLEAVYDGLFDLTKVFEQKSAEEVRDMLNTHYFCQVTSNASNESRTAELDEEKDVTDTQIDEVTDTVIDNDLDAQQKLDDLMKDL